MLLTGAVFGDFRHTCTGMYVEIRRFAGEQSVRLYARLRAVTESLAESAVRHVPQPQVATWHTATVPGCMCI